MSRRARAVCLAAVLSVAGVPAHGQTLVEALVASADPQPFSSDDLLWMEVQVDGQQAADTMDVYASRSGVFVPIAQFSRVLDLAIAAYPAQRRAEGWVLTPERKVVVDMKTRTATANGKTIPFGPDQAAIYEDDVYVRVDLLEQLLPLKLKANVSAQLLSVTAMEPLPFQQRRAREQRRTELGGKPAAGAAVKRIETPYTLFSPPAFDVNIGGQISRDGADQSQSYDVRAAGDLLYGTVQAFVGSDQHGEVSDARVTWERKDPDGHALGRLGGTRAGLGDVFTPSMAIGAASSSGRGLFYTSAPLDNLDISTPLDIRGELALGEEVELYVNEVLQASRASAIQGRYEFLDVPLTVGLNTIRLVFYGSQGQIREEVRRINFGAGQLEAGQVAVRLGLVQQDIAVIDLGRRLETREVGAPRLVAMVDYGLTTSLTASAGLARYTPVGREARGVGSVGLRGSLAGWAVQGDLAVDDLDGRAASASVAGRPFGVSIVGQHSEYRGGFVDETRPFGAREDVRLVRATDLRADGQVTIRKLALPLSVTLQHAERADGSSLLASEVRTSAPIGRYFVSTNLAYEQERSSAVSLERLLGGLDLATLVAAKLQLRGGLSYEISPSLTLEAAYASADYQLSEAAALRLSVIHALGPQGTTTLQGSGLYRASRFDLALNAGYDTSTQEWRLGVQLGFGFGYDPFAGRYRMTRPGVSGGGAVAFNAFVDANGDGHRQPDEAAVPKVVVDTLGGTVVTDETGRAVALGLGDAPRAQIRVTTEGVDDPYLLGSASALEVVPRPGRTVVIDYPLQVSGELELTAKLRRPDGSERPLSALAVELVPDGGGAPVSGRSDHGGVLYFEGVRPGAYSVRLAPEQASLGLALAAPLRVTIPAGGGFVRGGSIVVVVAKEAAS